MIPKNKYGLTLIMASIVAITSAQTRPDVGIEWAEIPAGSFMMGSPILEKEADWGERRHLVHLDSFKISKHAITVAQFRDFVETTNYLTEAERNSDEGSLVLIDLVHADMAYEYRPNTNWRHDEFGRLRPEEEYDHPVVHVSWNDAQAFAKYATSRLPTEAEWEYAARAGTTTPFYTGDCLDASQANINGDDPYSGCTASGIHGSITAVGSYPPNPWGLYDMAGNVWEWCADWKGDYTESEKTNPKGPDVGLRRVARSCTFIDSPYNCRSATRFAMEPQARNFASGFRVVYDENAH